MRQRELLLAIFFSSLPAYFANSLNFPIPAAVLVGNLYLLLLRPISLASTLKISGALLALVVLQIAMLGDIPNAAFARKIGGIALFYAAFIIARDNYDARYEALFIASFYAALAYALFAAPSYLLGYQQYLIPGTCAENNLSTLGHLRCGPFGEGNYFGGYICLFGLAFFYRPKVVIAAFLASLISLSPPAIAFTGYLLLRRYVYQRRLRLPVIAFAVSILALGLLINWNRIDVMTQDLLASEMTSTAERIEFIRAGLEMWINHPLIGVGIGQYGAALSEYSVLSQILERIRSEDYRFIANNNIVEVLSEQGLAGLAFFAFIIRAVTKFRIANISRWEILVMILLLGMTMPTLYQVVVGAFFGVFASGHARAAQQRF